MDNRSKFLFKNVGILTVSNFASKILVFLLVPLYTSVLSTEDVGIYDLAVSTATLLFPILTLNIVDAVMRFSMDASKSKEEIASIGLRIIVLSILPIIVFLYVISNLDIFQRIHGLEQYILFYYIFYALYQYLIQFSKGIEKVKFMGAAGVAATVTMIVSNILFLLVFKWGLTGFFVTNILSQAIPSCYLIIRIKLWDYIRFSRINNEVQKEMLVYCVPLIATVIGWWINHALDKYAVAFMVGVAANGLLSVSYKIPQIINTLQSIFIQAWQISAIKEYGGDDTSVFYGRAFIVINLLITAACSWLILLTKPLGHLLYQKEFFSAWQYVPFLLIASVLNSASGFLGPILSAKKDSKSMAMSALYGALANIIMNIVLIYFIGVQGATIATAISSFIIYWVRKRAVGNEIKINSYGIVLITWGLLAVQAIFEIYTRFWWAEIVIMLVMLFLNKNGIKELFKMGKKLIRT